MLRLHLKRPRHQRLILTLQHLSRRPPQLQSLYRFPLNRRIFTRSSLAPIVAWKRIRSRGLRFPHTVRRALRQGLEERRLGLEITTRIRIDAVTVVSFSYTGG